MGRTKVTVTKIDEGFAVRGEAGGFTLILDEPKSAGGEDRGMSPMQVLLCALGACQSMVAKAYADTYGVDVGGLSIDIEGITDPTREPRHPGLREVEYTMHFKAGADMEALERFSDFVEKRCTVMNSLTHEVKMIRKGIETE